MNRVTALCAVLVLALLAGCSSAPSKPAAEAQNTLNRIQQSLHDSQQAAPAPALEPIPEAVSAALLPRLRLPLPGAPAPEPTARFDLSVDRVDARAFFMGLVKDSVHNMVVHPSVDGTISLELKDVSVGEVMEVVRNVYGYEYERTPSGYVVLPVRLQSRIFDVSYVNINRQGESTTRVNSGQISDTREVADGSGETGDSQRVSRSIGSEIVTRTEADFWSQLRASVLAIIGAGEGRSVVVSPQAGLLVVRAMPGELRDVAQFLHAAQKSLHRQVILEAKVVEVRLNDAFQSGINWAVLGQQSNGAILFGQSAIANGASAVLDPDLNFDNGALQQPGDVGDFPFGGLFALGAATDEFGALITLLGTQGDAQVLSSPRVATINNQKAVIKVGTDEFFVTEVKSTTTTGTATTTTPSITLTPFFSGIALDVTPHITAADEVILHVHPTVSEVEDQTKNITVAGQTQTLPLAFSSVRESDSVVRARNGQVIVIGGLMQDRSRNEKGKTPLLGDLPLIGRLFQQDRELSSRSELVILLRPVIASSDGVWSGALGQAAQRVRDMDRRAPRRAPDAGP